MSVSSLCLLQYVPRAKDRLAVDDKEIAARFRSFLNLGGERKEPVSQ